MDDRLLDFAQVSEAAWSWQPESRDRALSYFREAVASERRLAWELPAEHEPELATALLGMSVSLSDLGRPLEALAAAHEAVLIGRHIDAAGTGGHQPLLAFALVNLSCRLRDMGQDERSLAAGEEAVNQCRQLGDGDVRALDHFLATALTGLYVHYSKLHCYDLALEAAQEAADVYQRLAAASPEAFEADLAASLTNLGAAMGAVKRPPSDALEPLRAAAGIHRRLDDVTPGAFEHNRAVMLNNLAVTLADCRDWSAALKVTEEAIPLQRRLAADKPLLFESALGRSLVRMALAHDKTDDPSDAALAAATEAINMFQRLAPTSLEAAMWLEQALLALENLLLTRDRLLLTRDQALWQRLADVRVSLCDRLAGPAKYLPAGLQLTGEAAASIRDALGRIDVATAVARTFLRAPAEYAAGDIASSKLDYAIDGARRCIQLFLSARRLVKICRRNLRAGVPGEPLSPDDIKTPSLPSDAIGQVKRSAAQAEDAFTDLVDQLSSVIASDDDLFANCITDLLDFLPQADAEGWALISAMTQKREPYKWIFTDRRIEADVAAFAFLEQLESGVTELVRPIDNRGSWTHQALQNIFEKTGPA